MTASSGAVAALLETIRYAAPPTPVDWSAVERVIGISYPAEFRELAEALPPGQFQTFLSLLHPRQFELEEYAEEVHAAADILRTAAQEEAKAFPYPIFPAPGGVLPWAAVGFDYLIGWLTEGDDPDAWPIVVCDSRLDQWEIHRLSTAGFLRAVLTYPSPVRLLGYVTEAQQPPAFEGYDGTGSAKPTDGPDEAYWNEAAEGRDLIGPADCVAELGELVTPQPLAVSRWDNVWPEVEGQIDWPLPEDYHHLAEELGAITVGPVTVAVPGGPLDLVEMFHRMRRRILDERAAGGGPAGTVWPEPRGILPWAAIEGGGQVCWLMVTDDYDTWPVLVLDAELRHSALYLMSASRFLLEVATNPAGVVLKPPA